MQTLVVASDHASDNVQPSSKHAFLHTHVRTLFTICNVTHATFAFASRIVYNRYVAFCMKRVNLLRHHGVEPIMVFDGASLPVKEDKQLERRRCASFISLVAYPAGGRLVLLLLGCVRLLPCKVGIGTAGVSLPCSSRPVVFVVLYLDQKAFGFVCTSLSDQTQRASVW